MKLLKTVLASAAISMVAVPAIAQEEAEEARTTYAVTMIDLADGADDRWAELHETYVVAAREAAGLAPEVVHWVMINPDYDLIIVRPMPGGMASFDSHANPYRDAFRAEMMNLMGSEENMQAIIEEWDTLVESSTTVFTHTHP